MSWRWTAALLGLVAVLVLGTLLVEKHDGGRSARLEQGLLFPGSVAELEILELIYPTSSFRLERVDEVWRLGSPVQDLADSVVVGRMLATLDAQDVERWLPPPSPGQLEDFGLAKPSLEMRLHIGRQVDTLRFGRMNEVEQRLWVQTSWRDSLALVSPLLRTQSMKGRFELTDKRPLGDAPRAKVESMRIENSWGSYELLRSQRGWQLRRQELYRADDRRVRELMDMLWGSSINNFIDLSAEKFEAVDLHEPVVSVQVKVAGEGQPRQLVLGKRFLNLYHAFNLDRPSVFVMDSTRVAPLFEPFSAFLATVLFAFHPGAVTELSGPDGRLRRVSETEFSWEDGDGRPVPGEEVAALVGSMLRIRTGRVEALLPRSDQIAEWGLDAPERVYELVLGEAGELRLELGSERDGRVTFRRGDYPTAYSLPAERLELPWPQPEVAP